MADTNPIGRLNEYGARHSLRLYDEYGHTGPDHNRNFICKMKLGEYENQGEGKTKKEAKVQAALNILAMLPKDDLPPIRSTLSPATVHRETDSSNGANVVIVNAKGSLQELCQRNQLSIPEYKTISKKGPSHDLEFSVSCCVKDINSDVIDIRHGNGKNKKAAEIDAAVQMKHKIELILPDIMNGISPARCIPRSGRPIGAVPMEDQLQLDELLAVIIGKGFNTPELLMQTSEPADVNDLSTIKHLCLALAQHSQPLSVPCSYDLATLPVAAQGIGSTEEEAKREALLNLVNNIHMLRIKL